jgi:hypothetical protein
LSALPVPSSSRAAARLLLKTAPVHAVSSNTSAVRILYAFFWNAVFMVDSPFFDMIRQIPGKEKAEHSCPCSAGFRQNFPAFIILRH